MTSEKGAKPTRVVARDVPCAPIRVGRDAGPGTEPKAGPGIHPISPLRLREIAAALVTITPTRRTPGPGEEGAGGSERDGGGAARRRKRPASTPDTPERRLMRAFADIRDEAAREHLLSLAEALATLSKARRPS